MSQYLTQRHQRMMDESEHALIEASQSQSDRRARISKQILNDSKIHSLWESRHADLLLPVAEQSKPSQQIVSLRMMATRLVHGRAIIEHIRDNAVRGRDRRGFFAYYYPQLDYDRAILSAHRHYTLSMSSMYSTTHLIDVMVDPVSHRLLSDYQDVYKQYFGLSSFVATNDDTLCADALAPLIEGARLQLAELRRKLQTVPVHSRCCEFEKQACLARSGRYPIVNYLLQ